MGTQKSCEMDRHPRGAGGNIDSTMAKQDWLLLAFLALVFLTGGGSRSDIVSLLLLRPASILVVVYCAYRVTRADLSTYRWGLAGITILAVLHVAHLIPIPPAWWTAMAGRQVIVDNLEAAGMQIGWRPLSMTPFVTWNSLFALSVPAAAFLVAVHIRSREATLRMLAMIAIFATASAGLGLLQAASSYEANLYPFAITNRGTAVGFFANRNHHAAFLACSISIIAYVFGALQRDGRANRKLVILAWGTVLLLFLAIIISGSRTGLLLAATGVATIPFFIDGPKQKVRKNARRLVIGGLVFGVILAIAIAFIPTNTLTRTLDTNLSTDLRWMIWPVSWQQAWQLFPWGSGMGTFVEAYKLVEPDNLLRTEYTNHAHNDWLELLQDAGLPGLLLLLCAMFGWLANVLRHFRAKEVQALQWLGLIVIGQLGIASFFDYPLRTPTLAAFFAIAVVCAQTYRPASRHAARPKS